MPAKELRFGDEARQCMMRGANILARAVKATLGPRGRNVVMQRSFGGLIASAMDKVGKEGVITVEEGSGMANELDEPFVLLYDRKLSNIHDLLPLLEPSVILSKVKEHKGNYGFNAQTADYGDMIEMGILDPTKVVRVALQNAASIAGLMITTEAMVAEAPRKEMPVRPGMDSIRITP